MSADKRFSLGNENIECHSGFEKLGWASWKLTSLTTKVKHEILVDLIT